MVKHYTAAVRQKVKQQRLREKGSFTARPNVTEGTVHEQMSSTLSSTCKIKGKNRHGKFG